MIIIFKIYHFTLGKSRHCHCAVIIRNFVWSALKIQQMIIAI